MARSRNQMKGRLARYPARESLRRIARYRFFIDKLLCTRFQGQTVGYTQDDGLLTGLPPLPPRIHSFIYPCAAEEVAALTQSLSFVPLLLNSGVPSSDEVIAACLRLASHQVAEGQDFLVRAGKALAVEMSGQLPRLNAILRRLS